MRNTTFISSMVLSVACVSAANAAVTFDSFTVLQSESNTPNPVPGINWASPPPFQPIFGASGTRAAFAFNYGGGGTTTSSSVSGGTATFTSTTSGGAGAGLAYSGSSARDLTGYTFSLSLNMTGPADAFGWAFEFANGAIQSLVNYTGPGTYTIDLNTLSGIDATTITSISIYTDSTAPFSATVSNFTFTYVPAPGAIALLGAAGFIGGRRRRA